MADDKKKGPHHDQEIIKPGKGEKEEIAEKDLDKASGGLNPQPLPPFKLPNY